MPRQYFATWLPSQTDLDHAEIVEPSVVVVWIGGEFLLVLVASLVPDDVFHTLPRPKSLLKLAKVLEQLGLALFRQIVDRVLIKGSKLLLWSSVSPFCPTEKRLLYLAIEIRPRYSRIEIRLFKWDFNQFIIIVSLGWMCKPSLKYAAATVVFSLSFFEPRKVNKKLLIQKIVAVKLDCAFVNWPRLLDRAQSLFPLAILDPVFDFGVAKNETLVYRTGAVEFLQMNFQTRIFIVETFDLKVKNRIFYLEKVNQHMPNFLRNGFSTKLGFDYNNRPQ